MHPILLTTRLLCSINAMEGEGHCAVCSVQCNIMQCNAMQYNAMQCNMMQCNAMQCNIMQFNSMQYKAMQCNALNCNAPRLLCSSNGMEGERHYAVCNAMHLTTMHCDYYAAMQWRERGTQPNGHQDHFIPQKNSNGLKLKLKILIMALAYTAAHYCFTQQSCNSRPK